MVSVIIPAHNEENVIAITLDALLMVINLEVIEVIVVCNGCSDMTVSIVKSYGDKIQCVETEIPSKTNALNLGDKVATFFPRIYLDADIVLSVDAVLALEEALSDGRYLAASTKMKMDYGKASWLVRSYYDLWQQLPYVKEGMIGVGVFALSEKGRSKFGKFPEIIADDGFVRAMFRREERFSVENFSSVVRSPTNLVDLVKIKTRSRLGRYELAEKFPELMSTEEKKYGIAFLCLGKRIGNWLKIPVYIYVNIVSRIRARRYYKLKGFTGWERDTSSRQNV